MVKRFCCESAPGAGPEVEALHGTDAEPAHEFAKESDAYAKSAALL